MQLRGLRLLTPSFRRPVSSLPAFASASAPFHYPPGSASASASATARAPATAFSARFFTMGSRMMAASTLPRLPIFEAVSKHDAQSPVAVHSLSGRTFTYGRLLWDVSRLRDQLRDASRQPRLDGDRVAFLVENSYDYVVTLLAVIAAKCIAVPLSPAFPASELQYVLNQSEACLLISSAKFASKAEQVLATELDSPPAYLQLEKHLADSPVEEVLLEEEPDSEMAGMMLYTSGTTNRPKGVHLPQSVLTAQAKSLVEAWEYSPADRLLHVLPLHHIHGTVNAILAPLFAGSTIEFMFPFNADNVWKRLAAPFLSPAQESTAPPKITFFTVVPTVYSRLLATHKGLPLEVQEAGRSGTSPEHMRLSISGSAALPTPVKAAWARLSGGTVLLERYGMTEVGMALSCGLDTADRVDASVGWPLPSVEARLVDVDTSAVIAPGEETDAEGRLRSGEIQLRGPTIFKAYWRNPEATAKEFVEDVEGGGSWFKTGDVAVRQPVASAGASDRPSQQHWARGPMYFIHGRRSADIIKTGGEKVSALEVERELLSLDEVAEAAVVAVPSGKWGQKVGAVIVLEDEASHEKAWSPLDMRRALRDRLANYKIPQVLRVVEHIPRNAMGKINKKKLVQDVFAEEFSDDETGRP